MASKSKREKSYKIRSKGRISIHIRIFVVIITVATVINVCGLLAGSWFLTRSIGVSMEDDMSVAVNIAEQFVTKEIELLKVKASEAAREIDLLYRAGETGVLKRVCAEYPAFTSMAVFSRTTLMDSWGESPVHPDLFHEPFIQIAMNGGQAVSSTMYAPDGSLVIYVSVPINEDTVLAAALNGMYFHNLLSRFTFWETGHIFINDGLGYVISNPRPSWVQERYNFLEMAKADRVYEGLGAATMRGIAGETGTARYHINGVLRLCAFRPISSPNEDWFVAIVAPLNETAVKKIPGGILLTGILTLILSVPVAIAAAVMLKRHFEEADHLREDAEITSTDLELKNTTLATLFDSIPELIFTMDKSQMFTQCNKIFLEHFGLRKENIIGKGEDAIGLPAEVFEEHTKWNSKVIEEGHTFAFEERIPHINGENPLYETVKAPLMLNGEVVGLLGIAHNITKRKEMEEAALAASNSKTVFLANMSHEIRTPMNSIVGFSELAMDDDISVKTRNYLEKIKTNADWLLQIINDILDVSKVEAGKMVLENIPFDLHELFVSCQTLILPKAVEKGLLLHFYAEPSIGKKPLGDPTRLRQVFVNLLSNSVKFTNTGMIKLQAVITGMTEKNITMHFEIKDSGIGMTEEQIKKIFDPFMQAESGTTRKYGGTGLGLAITKSILDLMGGELLVESTPGVGSKFSFDLTFDTIDISDEVLDEVLIEKKVVLNELEKPTFKGEILLFEDNQMNQVVICEHLDRVGLKTVIAENGKIGVNMVKNRMRNGEKQFDLIFMDMYMPVMDGLEATEIINKLNTGIPIVAMTANVMSDEMNVYKTKGINDCVSKPFTSQELWRCLLKYFKPVDQQTEEKNRYSQDETELRNRLVINFVNDSRNTFSNITQALNTGDIKLAHRLAHTLKGNAGQLGKTTLQQAAANVEKNLKDGENLVTEQQMNALETELNAALVEFEETLHELSQSGAETEAESDPQWLDSESARKVIEELEPLIETGNPKCRQSLHSLRRIHGSEELIKQLYELDFEPALNTLTKLKKSLGIL
ncbi:MAG: response regulator [Treponema sp.]|jgi:PAS domain S-box-containing protein|nr:response regulator [Treponema sp.]